MDNQELIDNLKNKSVQLIIDGKLGIAIDILNAIIALESIEKGWID